MIDLDRLEMDCKIAIANGSKYLPATKIDTANDMLELVARLRQAEKDAARYRSAVSVLGEASEMLQLLSLSASNVSERNMERVEAVVCEIDAELSQCSR
ncbi:MAG: hypothetical protein ACRDBQ_22140 [Shewanella sp.]